MGVLGSQCLLVVIGRDHLVPDGFVGIPTCTVARLWRWAQWVILSIIILILVAILLVFTTALPSAYGFSGISRIATTLARE